MNVLIAIGSLLFVAILGIWLSRENLRRSEETKEERMKAYRRYKREKNKRLARALGIDYKPKDE